MTVRKILRQADETLARTTGPQNYAQLWANELHPTAQGFDFLAAVIATKLREAQYRLSDAQASSPRVACSACSAC